MDAVLINGKQFFSVLKSSMDKGSLKNINVLHFFGHQFLVCLAFESVAPLGVQTAHILISQNIKPQWGLEALSKNKRQRPKTSVWCMWKQTKRTQNTRMCCVLFQHLCTRVTSVYTVPSSFWHTVFCSVNQSPNGLYSTVILVQDFVHLHAAAVNELMTLSTMELTFHEAQPL